jgi:hypothetical protein
MTLSTSDLKQPISRSEMIPDRMTDEEFDRPSTGNPILDVNCGQQVG